MAFIINDGFDYNPDIVNTTVAVNGTTASKTPDPWPSGNADALLRFLREQGMVQPLNEITSPNIQPKYHNILGWTDNANVVIMTDTNPYGIGLLTGEFSQRGYPTDLVTTDNPQSGSKRFTLYVNPTNGNGVVIPTVKEPKVPETFRGIRIVE